MVLWDSESCLRKQRLTHTQCEVQLLDIWWIDGDCLTSSKQDTAEELHAFWRYHEWLMGLVQTRFEIIRNTAMTRQLVFNAKILLYGDYCWRLSCDSCLIPAHASNEKIDRSCHHMESNTHHVLTTIKVKSGLRNCPDLTKASSWVVWVWSECRPRKMDCIYLGTHHQIHIVWLVHMSDGIGMTSSLYTLQKHHSQSPICAIIWPGCC